MGLLDDLKRQAEIRKQEEERNQAEKNRNLQAVNLALRNASRYFTELANSLNILKPEVTRTLFIEATTRFDTLLQSDYRVRERRKTIDHRDYFSEVILYFNWNGSSPLIVEKDTPALIQQLTNDLHSYNLRFAIKAFKNEKNAVERVLFAIEPEVIASVKLSGNWDTGIIGLSLKNVEVLGSIDFQYDAPELDPSLFDEITKLVLGKPNKLAQLGKHQEFARTRPWVRTKTSETELPAVEPPVTPESESKGGLLDRLKSLLER